jgi:hypothetical protein
MYSRIVRHKQIKQAENFKLIHIRREDVRFGRLVVNRLKYLSVVAGRDERNRVHPTPFAIDVIRKLHAMIKPHRLLGGTSSGEKLNNNDRFLLLSEFAALNKVTISFTMSS